MSIAKDIIMNYKIYRGKIYDNNSTKNRRRKWKSIVVKVIHHR